MHSGQREQKTNQGFVVALTGIVMPDGLGDAAHMEDLVQGLKDYQLANPQLNMQIVIVLACFDIKIGMVIDMFKRSGLLSADTEKSDDVFQIHAKNPGIFLMTLVRKEKDLSNDESPTYSEAEHFQLLESKVYREALKNVQLIMNISNAGMLEKFQDKTYGYATIFANKPRILHFPEHGCKMSKDYAHLCDAQYPMGLHRLFIKSIDSPDPEIDDKTFLSLLLNQSKEALQEPEQVQAAIRHFRDTHFFVPCYYKYNNSFFLYLTALVKSPLVAELKKSRIAVFINIDFGQKQQKHQGKDAASFENLAYLYALYQAGIERLELVTGEEVEERDLKEVLISTGWILKCAVPEQKTFKTLRVVNTRLSPHDFQECYKLADTFGGNSGDKSLEVTCMHGLVPLTEMRSYKAPGLRKEVSEIFSETMLENILVEEVKELFSYQGQYADCIWGKYWEKGASSGEPIIQLLTLKEILLLAERFARHITPENVTQVQGIMQRLRQENNLFALLPNIIESEMKLASAKTMTSPTVKHYGSVTCLTFPPQNNNNHTFTDKEESELTPVVTHLGARSMGK